MTAKPRLDYEDMPGIPTDEKRANLARIEEYVEGKKRKAKARKENPSKIVNAAGWAAKELRKAWEILQDSIDAASEIDKGGES